MESLALVRSYFHLYLFNTFPCIYSSSHQKLLLLNSRINTRSYRLVGPQGVVWINRGSDRCSWYSCLGFEARKNDYDSSCSRQKRYWKIRPHPSYWFDSIKKNIPFYFPSWRARFSWWWKLHFVSSWYTLSYL